MSFKIDTDFVKPLPPKPLPKPAPKPEPKPPVQQQYNNVSAKKSEAEFVGAINKTRLEKQFAANQPSPSKALEEINNLPKPDLNDKAAVKAYKEQRQQIADNAVKNSQPPRIEDYRNSGLNGATASYEYREAKSYYDSQISQLKKISADAQAYPDKILTPGEAVIEINNLPRPDRNDPKAIQEYNSKRAAIADSALMYAKPPTLDDFKGLNGATASYEYRQALSDYNNYVGQLREASNSRYSSAPPPMTDAEADKAAQDLINKNGGATNEDQAYAVGRDVAELAKTDPEAAALVMKKVQEKLNGTDKGDNVASGFVNNLSVEELREVSQANGGETVLKDLQNRLLSGSVHDNEYSEATKIDEAVTGLNPNSLQGDPEQDAKTIDEQLKNLPPEMREKYIEAVLKNPFGGEAIKYALVMSPEGQQLLGESLGKLYAKNPSETAALLKQITDAPNASLYPVSLQSGLAEVIGKSGNDDLIKAFAQNEINRAKGNPDEVRGYINAVTAYAGLSPEALQDVMKNNPDFFKAVEETGKILDAAGNNGGFLDPNIFEPGLGNLLKKASQIKGPNGEATPEAIKLFESVVKYSGDNISTKEGLGAFFIEHAQQLVDKYTNPEDPNALTSDVLQTFFADVVYHPLSQELKYGDKSLVESIMGNEKGEGGVIGDVVQTYLDAANKNPNDGEKDDLLGQRIGVLWGGISKGFLDSVQNHKDQWKEDKEFRDFTINALSFGLGKIADKFGIPGEVVDKPLELVQKMLDSKAEADQGKQIEAFKTYFKEFNTAMYAKLNEYDQKNDNVENMNTGFSKAFNLLLINDIIDEQIES